MKYFLLYVLIYSFICAVLCYVVADSKNRNGGSWGFAGFFCGILALIAITGMPSEAIKETNTTGDNLEKSNDSISGVNNFCDICKKEFTFESDIFTANGIKLHYECYKNNINLFE